MEGTLCKVQRRHPGSCKSIRAKREKHQSDREEGWGILLTILSGRWWPGDNGLFCFNHYVPDMGHRSCLAGGRCPCGLIHSTSPLSSHGSLHVAGALMAFKCPTCAHTILLGPVLSWKEDKGEALIHSGGSYWGAMSSEAFGTHQRVTLPRVPQLLPQPLPILRGLLWERRSQEMGKSPQVLVRATKYVMVWAWVGKELPDMRQKWRKNKVDYSGRHCYNSGPDQGTTDVEQQSLVLFYT